MIYSNPKRGDVVRLKSGGPSMVVEDLETHMDGAIASVIYFDEKKREVRQKFRIELLVKDDRPKFG